MQVAETTEAKSRLAAELEEHKEACKGTCKCTAVYSSSILIAIASIVTWGYQLHGVCGVCVCPTAQMASLQQNLEKRQQRVVALEAELATLQNSLSSTSILNEATSREKACVHHRSILYIIPCVI